MEHELIDNVDVVIIGAGIMGLSTAYYLAKKGLEVCIVERESYIGGHTTLRCAGGIRQQFSSRINIELSILNRRLIQCLEQESRCTIPFHACGYAFAFTKDHSAAQAEKTVAMQRGMGIPSEILSAKDTATRFPNIFVDDVLRTTYCRDDGLINVGALLGLLKRELFKRKVRILCEKNICKIETQHGAISKVLLDKGEIHTKMVVNAAGPWAKQIGEMLGITIPIEPSCQQVWVTDPILWVKRDMPVIVFVDEGIGFHWEAGGLLSGYHKPNLTLDMPYPNINPDWEILHCQKAVERIPSLSRKHLTGRWAGFYETTMDDLPIVGSCGPDGMYCIAGFNGHGISQGIACGYLLSRLITGEPTAIDMSCLSLDRFKRLGVIQTEAYKI